MFQCYCRLVGMISDLEASGGSDSNSLKESESLKVLRAVRVLRPLKIVSGIPSECIAVLFQ